MPGLLVSEPPLEPLLFFVWQQFVPELSYTPVDWQHKSCPCILPPGELKGAQQSLCAEQLLYCASSHQSSGVSPCCPYCACPQASPKEIIAELAAIV